MKQLDTTTQIRKAFETPYFPLSDTAVVVLEDHLNDDPNLWDCAWREFDSFASAYISTAWVYGCGNHSIDEQKAKEWFEALTATIEFDGGVLINIGF